MNDYIVFFKGKSYEIQSDTTYHAQLKFIKQHNVKKSEVKWIDIWLAKKDGKIITHAPVM